MRDAVMYSYNNIIQKAEPQNKAAFDHLLMSHEEWHARVFGHPSETPEVTTSWRYDASSAAAAHQQEDLHRRAASHGVPSDDDVIVVEHLLTDSECQQIIDCCEDIGFTFWNNPSADAGSSAPACHSLSSPDGTTAAYDETSTRDNPGAAFRTAYTVELHQPTFAGRLWDRLRSVALDQISTRVFAPDMPRAEDVFEPDMIGCWQPVGVCDDILFARYRNGGHFAPHVDGSNIMDLNTRTLYTVLIYLNDCCSGGETFILQGDQCDVLSRDGVSGYIHSKQSSRIGAVAPRRGRAAVFYHNVLHEGAPVAPSQGAEVHEKYIVRADVLYRRDPPILTEANDVRAFQLYQEARLLEADGRADEAVKKFQLVKKVSRGVAELYQL